MNPNYAPAPFELFQQDLVDNSNQNTIKHTITETTLSKSFFSKQNIDKIQNEIIRTVYQKSEGQYKIGRQSDHQLLIIMRSIYLQNSKNLECNIQNQIDVLNYKVLDYCVNNIKTEILQYLGYLKDIKKPIKYTNRPTNVSSKGNNILTNNIGL